MADNLAAIRQWVGSVPDDVELLTLLAAGDEPQRIALQILRVRYADMVTNPAKWAVVDDYSQDGTANLKALAAQIGRLENALGEGEVTFTSTPICGPSMER